MIYVFTSAAANYLPKARLLFHTLKQYHPEFHLVLALVDEQPPWLNLANESFDEVLTPDQLNIANLKGWLFRHSIVELCTAVKPFVLAKLLERPDCEAVLYFDPDMALFSRLDDLLADLSLANLALTPHLTVPENNLEAIMDNEICSLQHGVYNLGFIAVRQTEEGKRFAAWWSERLYHFCRADIPQGLFTDQRWIDLVPAFFEGVKILKSPRFNVATWNITNRKLAGDQSTGFLVNGLPLGFYHFTGFDRGDHQLMANKNAPGNQALQGLIKWYAQETASSSYANPMAWDWAYGQYNNGTAITAVQRLIYRLRTDVQQAFPNPFEITENKPCYYYWLRETGTLEHPDLLAGEFPLPPQPTKLRKQFWALRHQLRQRLGTLG